MNKAIKAIILGLALAVAAVAGMIFVITTVKLVVLVVVDAIEKAGYGKKPVPETVPEQVDTLSLATDTLPIITYDTLPDKRDGKTYKAVKIGKQVWTAENMNYQTDSSWCCENSLDTCAKYGRLYTWKAAQKACPAGYHLPTRKEWQTLVDYTGDWSTAGKKLKSRSGWIERGNGTDDFGFKALPNRYCVVGGSGIFFDVGKNGSWWTATEKDSSTAYIRDMVYNFGNVGEFRSQKSDGRSVRCLKDD